MVTYLGRVLDEDLLGESMATKVMGKINGRIKFLYRKNRFLDSSLRRLVCNALVQPNLNMPAQHGNPTLTQNLRKKLQTTQNKCIRFCLQLGLGNRAHIGATEFKQINWLPIYERFSRCACSTILKFFKNNCLAYVDEMFSTYTQDNTTQIFMLKLCQPYRKTLKGQKGLSYVGPSVEQN